MLSHRPQSSLSSVGSVVERQELALDTSHLLSVSATPVVLVSACGLVTLALYNRLGVILARIRAFHQHKIGLLESLDQHEPAEQQMLLEMLDSQIVGVTAKAKVIQKGLYCLLAAIAATLLCSLFTGEAVLHDWAGIVAITLGFLGLSLFLAGLGLAMWELTLSLTPLEEEKRLRETPHRPSSCKVPESETEEGCLECGVEC